MKLFSLSEFSLKALAAFKRFPLTLLWVMASAVVLVTLVELDADSIFEEHRNVTLIAILGVSWLIGVQFYTEQFKKKGLWWIKMILILLLIGFYFLLPPYESGQYNQDGTPYVRWILFFLAGHLALLFAPFITVWHPKAYWNYLGDMMIALARSGLFSGVLYLGLVLALLAVKFLFDIDIEEYRYFQLFIICLGIVNTWVYLSDFPKEIQHNIHLNFYKATEVFVKFILIPLAILYLIILYAYTIKILLQWELPKGWVSYLITALAGLLFIIQYIIHPVRITHESRLIRKFTPLVYWLLLPLLVLLYIAIYKRISDYGITEARYFLLILAIFITGATLYLIFSRKKQLRYLPMALALFAIMGSFGFWGAFTVSECSQLRQFEQVYNAFAKIESTTISREDADRFRSITSYLVNHNKYDEMAEILGYNPKEAFRDKKKWELSSAMLDSLKITIDRGILEVIEPARNYYNSNSYETVNIEGYQWSRYMRFNTNDNSNGTNFIQNYYLNWSRDDQLIEVLKDGQLILTLPLSALVKKLRQRKNDYESIVPREILSVQDENESIAIKIYFSSVRLWNETNEAPKVEQIDGTVLIKIKE